MIVCPHCNATLRTTADIAGRKVTCPGCRRPFVVATAEKRASAMPATATGPRWFYAQDRQRKGPVTLAELANLIRRGELTREAMVLPEGEQKWQPVVTVKGLFRTGERAAPASKGVQARPAAKGRPPSRAARDGSGDPSYGKTGRRPLVLALGGIGLVAALALVGWRMLPTSSPKIDEPPGPSVVAVAPIPSTPTAPTNPAAPPAPKSTDPQTETFSLQEIDVPKITAALVDRLNAERKAAGLSRVVVDPELSAGCQAHAAYVVRNLADPRFQLAGGLRGESPGLPGAGEAGRAAAAVAVQSQHEPTHAFAIWWGRLASRLRLIQPDLAHIGVGVARNERGDWVTVLDPLRGLGPVPIAYPAAGQKDVPPAFSGGPEGKLAGHPISLDFPPDVLLADFVAVLTDEAGNRIASDTSTPAKPLPGVRSKTTIGILPKAPLKGRTPYRVRFAGLVDDRKFEKTWEFTTEDDVDADGKWAQRVLERINAARRRVGQEPVTLDADLSLGCSNHARYLALNAHHPATQGLGAHNEDASLPGATPQGAKAGAAADIALSIHEPTDAVDGWIATFYHRVPLLDPRLKRIGFGCARGERLGWIAVVNIGTARDKGPLPGPIAYPAEGQEDVPCEFPPGGEIPDPIPEDKTGRAGFPITVTFPVETPLIGATGMLEDERGEPVPCWFSSPEKPANPKLPIQRQGTTVCLIPKAPLEPAKTYKVRIAGRLGEMPWQKEWLFHTVAAMSPEEAARQVADRLNQVRQSIALPAVAVDAELSKGCREYADYLRKNADLRKQPDFVLGGERTDRPGYTVDGERTAKRADVFFDAPRPTLQIDDSLATLSRRSRLLESRLARIGVGCSFEPGRGWTCVLDLQSGIAESGPILVPAAAARNVPTDGFDRIPGNDAVGGFPICALFGPRQQIQSALGTLTDSAGNAVEAFLSSPTGPLSKNITEPAIALHPRQPLRPGETYTVTIRAVVDGRPQQLSWHFETAAAP